nr:MAG TPA: bacterioferritin-associated protein [Caudoviricetes sp.]
MRTKNMILCYCQRLNREPIDDKHDPRKRQLLYIFETNPTR